MTEKVDSLNTSIIEYEVPLIDFARSIVCPVCDGCGLVDDWWIHGSAFEYRVYKCEVCHATGVTTAKDLTNGQE